MLSFIPISKQLLVSQYIYIIKGEGWIAVIFVICETLSQIEPSNDTMSNTNKTNAAEGISIK